MKKCLIVSGGKIETKDLLTYLKHQENDIYIIGVDGGCQVLYDAAIVPNHILGDFDSLDKKIKAYYVKEHLSISELDPIKDVTDTHAAFEIAKELGAEAIDVFGFLGTRLDHSLGAIMMGFKYSESIHVRFFDSHNIVYFVDGKRRITVEKTSEELQKEFRYLSIIPIEEAHIIKTINLKYPLKAAQLFPYDSYGVSNEINGRQGTIEVKEGKLLIIQSND